MLLLGINPGSGTETSVRTPSDARMMPAQIRFAQKPTPQNFVAAQQAYKAECQTWHIWRNHCRDVIGAGKLSLDEIAYSNCLPWRSGSKSALGDAVREKAATLYAHPLIEELQPTIIIALGKTAAAILNLTGKSCRASSSGIARKQPRPRCRKSERMRRRKSSASWGGNSRIGSMTP
ncbi:MAG: hypothetical protein HC807_07140 [Gammaproteobacteria bacterium]|nr:hypothetical protein [Gammaproteobacteria bacterium]